MTTIATDGKSMAGDGQRESNGTIIDTAAEKVRLVYRGRDDHTSEKLLIGTAGEVDLGNMFVVWINGGPKPDIPSDAAFGALVLHEAGIDMYGPRLEPIRVPAPAAIGSGMDLALGAMAAGASPPEAVAIAARYDPSTGGTILHDSLRHGERRFPRRGD